MPVIVAKHAGFCMGVKQAVERTEKAAGEAQGQGLARYTLGELIHNPSVVARLAAKGIHAVTEPEAARGGLLILRSHGVAPDVAKRAYLEAARVLDCTCPFVKKLHSEVERFSAEGAPVILMGDTGHPEIIGTAGYCKGPVYVVSNREEIDALPREAADAMLAAQTTFPPSLWEELSSLLLKRFPLLTVKYTICSATALRQEEAADLAQKVDAMLVVGGRNSANTLKLYETCKSYCPESYLVERAKDIPSHLRYKPELLIGVTAGASTPEWSLKEVIDRMNDMEHNDLTQESQVNPADEQAQALPQEEGDLQPQTTSEEVIPQSEPEAEAAASESAKPEDPVDAKPQGEDTQATTSEPVEEERVPTFMDEVAASMTRIRAGQTVTGKVVQITEDEVCVNIGFKSDGLIKRSEMVDTDVELGDEIDVEIVKVNDGEGNVILSQRNIVNRKVWEDLMAKYEAGEFVDAVGKEAVKGGLLANIEGVRAFIPASQLSQRYVEKITQFVGQPMKLKIIEVDASKKRVVASRKEVIAYENALKKDAVWSNLQEGAIIKGIVRRFATFGAFVDIGGVDGLIHITDLSWNRSAQPQDILSVNQEIEVKILSLDPQRERIQLGYKQLQARPWDNIEEKYPVGEILIRKVVRIRPFGAFIELEPGVDGLVHISQVSHTRIDKVEDVLTPGQEVSVKVLGVDPDAKRISLSIKEATEAPAQLYDAQSQYPEYAGEYSDAAAPIQAAPAIAEEAPRAAADNQDESPVAAAFRRAQEVKAEADAQAVEAVADAQAVEADVAQAEGEENSESEG